MGRSRRGADARGLRSVARPPAAPRRTPRSQSPSVPSAQCLGSHGPRLRRSETLFCTFHSIPPPVTSFRKQKPPGPALKRPRTSRPLKGPRRLPALGGGRGRGRRGPRGPVQGGLVGTGLSQSPSLPAAPGSDRAGPGVDSPSRGGTGDSSPASLFLACSCATWMRESGLVF